MLNGGPIFVHRTLLTYLPYLTKPGGCIIDTFEKRFSSFGILQALLSFSCVEHVEPLGSVFFCRECHHNSPFGCENQCYFTLNTLCVNDHRCI